MKDDGFVTIVLLIDGYQEAGKNYVDYYGLTMPVLNDETMAASQALGAGYDIPYYILVGRDMTILSTGGSPAPANILHDAIDESRPDVDRPLQPDEMGPEELDDEDLGLPAGTSPFSAEAEQTWEEGNACAIGSRGASPAAALLLLPLLALILRCR